MASGEARYDSLHRGHIEGLRLERERELAKLREDCDTARAERDATRSKLDKAISRKVAVEAEVITQPAYLGKKRLQSCFGWTWIKNISFLCTVAGSLGGRAKFPARMCKTDHLGDWIAAGFS